MAANMTAAARTEHAVLAGSIYGCLHAVGPDHLGTLLTLSSLSRPGQAFLIGAAWGSGHCFGLVFIAMVFMALNRLTFVDPESWEHIGDYCIGISMVLCAVYFLLRESDHVETREDGTFLLKGCACCDYPREEDARKEACCPPCPQPDYWAGDAPCPRQARSSGEPPESASAAALEGDAPQAQKKQGQQLRYCGGAAVGVCQGACCPMGLVGMSFMANLGVAGVLLFALTFAVISVLGTGLISMGLAYVTAGGVGASLPQRAIYRGSCAFTLSFGVAWIVANYFGVLARLNYAEGGGAF